MSWLDRLLVTPVVGVMCHPTYEGFSRRLERLAPVWQELHEQEKTPFILQWTSPMSLDATSGGWHYQVTIQHITVEYKYSPDASREPGVLEQRFPSVEKYSVLLADAAARVARVAELLFEHDEFRLVRGGIVANVELDLEALPPGVSRCYSQLAGIWGKSLEGFIRSSGDILIELERGKQFADRCHHVLVFDRFVSTRLASLRLDWQRHFTTMIARNGAGMNAEIAAWIGAARDYFEKFGSGEALHGQE